MKQKESQRIIDQHRSQFYKSFGSGNSIFLDGNTGSQILTDSIGKPVRQYLPTITGIASAQKRIRKSSELQDTNVAPDVPETIKHTNYLSQILNQAVLNHFLPKKRSNIALKHKDKTYKILKTPSIDKQQAEYHNAKYLLNNTSNTNKYLNSRSASPKEQKSLFKQKKQIELTARSQASQSHILIPETFNNHQNSNLSVNLTQAFGSRQNSQRSTKLLSPSMSSQSLITINNVQPSVLKTLILKNQSPFGNNCKQFADYKTQNKSVLVLEKFDSIKKQNLANKKITGFLDNSRSFDYITQPTISLQNLPPATGDYFYTQQSSKELHRTPSTQSLLKMPMQRDHSTFNYLYNQELQQRQDLINTSIQSLNDYSYPLTGSKQMDQIGVNRMPVKLSKRTKDDFDPPVSLQPIKLSRSQYELYTIELSQIGRSQTKNRFQSESEKVIKHPGELAFQSSLDLLRMNPDYQVYKSWKQELEDRKMNNLHKMKELQEKERKSFITLNEQKIKKMIRKKLKSEWMRDVKERSQL